MSKIKEHQSALQEALELKKKELAVYQQCKDGLNIVGIAGGALLLASCLFTIVVMLLGHLSDKFDKVAHVGLIVIAATLIITVGAEVARSVIVKRKRREILAIVKRMKGK